MQPPAVKVQAWPNNESNISTIKKNDTIGDWSDYWTMLEEIESAHNHGYLQSTPIQCQSPQAVEICICNQVSHIQVHQQPASIQQYIGNPWISQGRFFLPGLAVPSYVRYQEPVTTLYLAENIQSVVPKQKKDDTDSFLVFAH